jgi:lysyl-tRNA synthetase class 2
MTDLIREHAGAEMHPEMPLAKARAIADDRGIPWLDVWGAGKIMSEVYDDSSEAALIDPTFVIDHPREISPLARAHRDDPALVERFELVVAGRELANAYSELNDPVDQAGRFQAEAEQQAGGEEEAEPVDDDYVDALEYGLPPTGGLGIGIDRLVMLIAGQEAIREVILFPTLRPEGAGETDDLGAVGDARAPSAADVAAATAGPAGLVESPSAAPTVPAPTRRPRSLRPLAWASVVAAVFSLLPTVTGSRFSIARFRFVSHDVRSVGLIASVVIGIWLIAIARGLARGKRRAWALSLVLFAAAAVVHLLRGPDPLAVLLSVAMLIALIWFRHDFRAQSDRGSLAQAIAFVPLYLLGVLAITAIALFAERHHIHPGLTVGGVIRTTYGRMIGLSGPYTYERRVFREFIEVGLPVLGISGLLMFLYLVLRTFVQAQPPSAERRARAERIVRTWGDDTLDYFALRRDKNYYFSADGRSLIAYLYVRGVAMVAGDPVGPPDDTARTVDEFLHFCAGHGWRTAFFAVRESDQQIYRDRGMHVIYLGDEAIVSCREFTLDTPAMKDLRAVVRRLDRDHTFELISESEASPALVAELNQISEEWRDGAPERGFTMELGQEVEGTQTDFVIAFAREAGGRVGGFLRFVPVYGQRPGYSLDLMRRRPDAANGITEYLIARAALGLGARGFDSLSLNFAAWGRLLDSAEDAGWSGRMQRLMAKGLNPFFQIQSLRDFNQKFNPSWVPRSVVIDDLSDLPRIALLYASVEGFLEVPVLGRLLEPPLRQQVDAAGSVADGEPVAGAEARSD